MPILKVPQKQKFGIISLTRVGELLIKPDKKGPKSFKATALHNINQAFVAKYNSKPKDARESMDVEISSALQHAKYKTGVKHASDPSSPRSSPNDPKGPQSSSQLDVTPYDTSIAWLQLTLLCQCNGPLQQGLCYQWLKNDMLSQGLLRMGEVILLKILYSISLRLYYHHLTGNLMESCTRDEMRQLKFDLEGFENKEKSYRNLPEALLHWKVALEVGLLVCEQYSKSMPDLNSTPSDHCEPPDPCDLSDPANPPSVHPLNPPELRNLPSREKGSPARSVSTSVSHGGSNICPILWHSLDLWQCTKQRKEVLQEAIQDLLACSTEFTHEKWIEGVLAMNILCTTAQVNLDALHLVQSLAQGNTQQSMCSKTVPQRNPTTLTTKAKKPENAVKASDGEAQSIETGATFLIPTKNTRFEGDSNAPSSPSKTNKIATLNVLGMQPDFSMADYESVYTADQTVLSNQTKTESKADAKLQVGSADKLKHDGYARRLVDRHGGASDYRAYTLNSTTVTSVGTQSLIANESIPDVLPSAEVSNVTMLDLGSITTLDPVESLGKSIGLFTSSNSKNLDISVSNLVSPGLGPSGELTSIDELGTSALSPNDASHKPNPADVCIPEEFTSSEEQASKAVKKVAEVNWESMDRVRLFHNEYSTLEPVEQVREVHSPQVQPQHVRVVLATPSPDSRPGSRCTHYTHSTAPLAGGANMLGSQVHPSTVLRQSMMTGEGSVKVSAPTRLAKFESWPMEVALAYTFCMGLVCIHGRSSLIQKVALEGREEGERKGSRPVSSGRLRNYGLLELTGLQADEKSIENTETKHDFMSWSIRHAAILSLSRVTKACRSLPMKDGLSDVAWWKLEERYKAEADPRVIQAFSIAQVTGSDLDVSITCGESLRLFSPLLAHIADGLSELFLPSPPSMHCITKPTNKVKSSKAVPIQSKRVDVKGIQSRVKTDVDGKPKVLPRPSFNTRTFGALNKIAEEHWKRQMLEEEQERTGKTGRTKAGHEEK